MAKKNIFKKTVSAPAELLHNTIKASNKLERKINNSKAVKDTKKYWETLGPGLTTGAADDDPSGVATYSQTGAKYGFSLIWLSLATYPLMSAVQEMCTRISLVTGRGLAGNIRSHFPKKFLYFLTLSLFIANSFNIGANLGMMAETLKLINPSWNFTALIIAVTVLLLAFQIFVPYKIYAKYLKWLALVLFAYIFSALLTDINWGDLMISAVRPSLEFNKEQLIMICAILGTTISPYLFFWQSSQEIEEKISAGKTTLRSRQDVSKQEVKRIRVDIWSGMLLSNIVMFFIVATCGEVLFSNGITDINSASQAAEALRPFAGDMAYGLFAVGIIGVGLLAIPVLAGSSSYAISESLGWRQGLSKKLKSAYGFYGIIIISMLLGLSLNFVGMNPIDALIYSAIINGIVAPLVLVPIVIISSNKKIMGEWTNKLTTTIVGWIVVALMVVSGIGAIVSII